MRNSDGELKFRKDVVAALRAAGLGANTTRLSALPQKEVHIRPRPADEEVSAQLRNTDGTFKTVIDVARTLRASGWRIGEARISTLLRKERDREDEMH